MLCGCGAGLGAPARQTLWGPELVSAGSESYCITFASRREIPLRNRHFFRVTLPQECKSFEAREVVAWVNTVLILFLWDCSEPF